MTFRNVLSLLITTAVATLVLPFTAFAQVTLGGVVAVPVAPGAEQSIPLTSILSIASPYGSQGQSMVVRTKSEVLPWEHDPRGWYGFSGSAGFYTLGFTNPSYFMRPVILTNVFGRNGESLKLNITPSWDYAVFDEGEKDEKPASGYYQLFTAKGTSLTHIGFKPIWEVRGGDSESDKDILVSVHRRGPGTPDTWEQVGPTATVPFKSLNNIAVEGAGARGFPYSAGWNSGEVPLRPGEIYAVHLRPRSSACTFQMFWRPSVAPKLDCYRIGADGAKAWTGKSIWMAVGTDNDGLLIPYNKRLHVETIVGTKWTQKWSQTYIAQGRSLAMVVLYAMGTTEQLPLNLQRVVVRVREGGPDGPVVGVEKIAKGNGEWTGDATWGTFSAVFAPGEVPLKPGGMYAIEFETFENFYTLDGYINIKQVPSGTTGGFSPVRRAPEDAYAQGRAFVDGKTATDFDLDMQVVEYECAVERWSDAVDAENLIENGDIQAWSVYIETEEQSAAEGWKKFKIDPDTLLKTAADPEHPSNMMLRVMGGAATGKTADGGFFQRIMGLSDKDTYRLYGKVRSSWAVDDKRQCFIGYDPTGQTADPQADTIHWTVLPPVNGVFVPFVSEPIRPRTHSISVWLRARTTTTHGSPIGLPGRDPFGFVADFDDLALHRIHTGVPGQSPIVGTAIAPAGLEPQRYLDVSRRVDDLISRLPGRPVMTGKSRRTKLGLRYFEGAPGSKDFAKLADSGLVPIIKADAQSSEASWRVVQHNPEAIWIVPGHLDLDPETQTPEQAADASYRMAAAEMAKIPKGWQSRVDFIELTPRMWEPKNPEQALWYSEFLCELLPRVAGLGPRPIVLNSGVGWLPVDKGVLAGMVPGLRLAKHLGGAWGCHGFTIKYTTDEAVEFDYSLRYRRAYDYFRRYASDLIDLPMILLEGGVNEAGDPFNSGWRARGSLEKYTEWLAWYDRQLMRDDYVLGVALFKIGDPNGWKSFDHDPVVPWLLEHHRKSHESKGAK